MNDKKQTIEEYVLQTMAQAKATKLRGSITFHFNEGHFQKTQIICNDTPDLDERG